MSRHRERLTDVLYFITTAPCHVTAKQVHFAVGYKQLTHTYRAIRKLVTRGYVMKLQGTSMYCLRRP